MANPIDLSTLSADDLARVASWNPTGVIAALAALAAGSAVTEADNAKLHAIAATAAEINALHSQGAVATDVAKLHAITASAAEVNALAGQGAVTTDVAKLHAVTASAAEINALHSQGAVTTDFAKLHALTASAAEVNALAGQGAVTTDIAKLHALTAAAATLNQVAAAAGTVTFDRSVKVAKVALAAVDTGGGVFSWTNPEAGSIIIVRVMLDVTTPASGACTVDIGTTPTNGTTSSNNLLTALDVHTAAGVFDNLGDAGASGKGKQKLATGQWVTASKASGASAALIGFAYIHYFNV